MVVYRDNWFISHILSVRIDNGVCATIWLPTIVFRNEDNNNITVFVKLGTKTVNTNRTTITCVKD